MNPPTQGDGPWVTAALTAFTMVAFAANSVLCRMALGRDLIDPQSFTTARLVSGAMVLVVFSKGLGLTAGRRSAGATGTVRGWKRTGAWASALALFGYAAAFSLAYVSLDAGTGALILFGAVQATMIGEGIRSGERPHWSEWLGLGLAVGGLIYLTAPGATAPDPVGAFLMLLSGISWGVYSLLGKSVRAPVITTARSFVRAAPLAIAGSLAAIPLFRVEPGGLLLAVTSGAVTSGLGYALWYRALRGLTRTRAAIVQLVVPVLAAVGGVVFLAEAITLRLLLASVAVLGGVGIAVATPRRPTSPTGTTGSS